MIHAVFSRMERYADVLAKNVKLIQDEEEGEAKEKEDETSERQIGGVTQESVSTVAADDSKLKPNLKVVGMFDDDGSAAASGAVSVNGDEVLPSPTDNDPQNPIDVSSEQEGQSKTTVALSHPHAPTPYDATITYYNALLKKDAFILFRLLCRLSAQTESGPTTFGAHPQQVQATDDALSPTTLKIRSLALELILSILNNAGTVLQTEDSYADLVKTALAPSISRNAITTNPVLFEFSLSIFLMLIRYYRARMKAEVEVLLNTVYLHILEMGNSTFKQKAMVLQGLQKILETPQTLVDMYLNYDCDLQSISLFERVCTVCSRVAQGKEILLQQAPLTLMGLVGSATGFGDGGRSEVVRMQEGRLKLRGALCLVAIVNSLVVWGCDIPTLAEDLEERKSTSNDSESDDTEGHGTVEEGLSPKTEKRGGSISTSAQTSPTRGNAAVPSSVSESPTAAKLLQDALSSDSPVILTKNRLHNVTVGQKSSKEGGIAAHYHHSHQHHHHHSGSSTVNGTPVIGGDRSAAGLVGDGNDTSVGASSVEAIAQRKLLMKQAVKYFEEKPVKGVALFKKHGFIPPLQFVGADGVNGSDEDNEAYSIATFLRTTAGLNKSAIGSYLGEGTPFCIKVMHMFVDALDFEGLGIVEALRTFLQTFRLPGESQKIDRLMEKFADRYCETNPDTFAKADTAYTLAFSIIMLNTDAHSLQIKNKMDKAGFLKNNRGINDNTDLPDEYLAGIYDEILGNEIIMEDEQTGKFAQMVQGWGVNQLSEKEKMDLYRKEIAQIQKKSQQLLASSGNVAPFRTAVQSDLARPMFATACWPLIATFSQLFESYTSPEQYGTSDDLEGSLIDLNDPKREEMNIIDLCLEGFAGGIKIASTFKMEMEREAFVTSLSKLTGLSHFRDFKPKNVKAIKTLLGLTLNFAEHLDTSWVHVVKVISQMERLQLLGSRGASLDSTRTDDLTRANPNVEKFLSEFTSQDTIVTVDRIFTSTTSITGPSILQFFKAVCSVSLEEVGIDPISVTRVVQMQGSPTHETGGVSTPAVSPVASVSGKTTTGIVTTNKTDGPPRMYLLQKIVEIAHYNMHRIRFEWTQIWRVLQPHFVVVGCHPNVHVASFAVDALRQLSMKFLEREELVHFSTQNEFLKSFERIMKLTTDDSIRHMILGSLGQMISARAGSIRSGWKPIFVVLARPTLMVSSSNDFDELLLESFQLVQTVFKEYFPIVVHAGALLEFINCVADFALLNAVRSTHDEIILSSIQLLQLSASQMIQIVEDEIMHIKLKTGDAQGTNANSAATPTKLVIQTAAGHYHPGPNRMTSQPLLLATGLISEEHFFLKWFPIFSAFSRITMGSSNLTVRTKCIESLFEVLGLSIHMFDLKCVRSIYRSAILPIFDDLKVQFDKMEYGANNEEHVEAPKQGSATIWILGLRLTMDLFSEHFSKIASDRDTITSILDIALSMMQRRDQTLVATGQICLHQFIQQNVGKFAESKSWDTIVDSIEKAFRMTNPFELVNCDFSSMKHLPEPPPSMIMNVAALGNISTLAPEVLTAVVAEGTATAQAHGSFVSLESLDFNQTILKCSVHIELLQSIRDSILAGVGSGSNKHLAVSTIPSEHRLRLLQCIRDSYTVSRCFNANYHLRYSIWKKRLVQQLPNLIKQETISIASHVKILFAIYRAEGDPDEMIVKRSPQEKEWATDNVNMLVTETVDLMERYVMMLGDAQVNATNIGLWSPVVVLVFRELLAMDCWWKSNQQQNSKHGGPKCLILKKQLPKLFRLGIRMMGVDRVDVRQALQGFIEKVGEELFSDMFLES
ncbi:hypothetical protein BDR26DRAFT_842136 [Obelidium mucronatum]|nr:hypothetical protein BDR26DRAFT_842136 [Obelidium mucronatum]